MSSRTQNAYTAVLQLRDLLGPNISLRKAISDFETAEQNAWREVFNIMVQGCLWHLCRAFIQEVATLNLVTEMKSVPEVRKVIRLTMALALLPEDKIVTGFNVVKNYARQEGRFVYRLVKPYLKYLWTYWIMRRWRRQRMCVYGSIHRTNNACESHNRALHKEVGTHPNVYSFISGLVRLEQRAHNLCLQLEKGRIVPGRKRRSVANDARVRTLSEELMNHPPGQIDRSIFRFLSAASHTMANDGRRTPGKKSA